MPATRPYFLPRVWRPGHQLAGFTRASVATYHAGPSPLAIASVASGVARPGHFQKGRRTLLVEGQRTNQITRSADPSHADWTKDDVTVDAGNPCTAPDGTSVSLILEAAVNSTHGIVQNQIITDGETLAVSAYFRKRERFRCEIIVSGGGGNFRIHYNVNTGTKGESATGGAAVVRTYVDATFANLGWYRLVAVGTLPGGVTTATCSFFLNDDAGTSTYTGETNKGAYWWGMQLERGCQFASSYIPTVAASGQRNGEVGSIAMPFNPQEMWVYVRFIELGTVLLPTGTFPRIWDISASFPNNTMYIVRSDAGVYGAEYVQSSSISTSSVLAAAPALFDVVEFLVTLGPEGRIRVHQSINGAAVTSGGIGAPNGFGAAWNTPTMYIGSANGSSPAFAAYERLAFDRGSLGSGTGQQLMEVARSLADG